MAAITLLVLSACAASAAQPSGGASTQAEPPPGIVPPGEWTVEQENRMVDMVRAAEEALPQFNDPAQLPPGFVNIGVLSAGYSHYVNTSWFTDEHILDPNFPESLVYAPTGEVVAAMYFLGPEYNLDNLPPDIAWLPGWHAHPELCSDEQGRVIGFTINGQCTAGQPALVPMMHVWITDPGCGHRFGGLGVGGLECEYNHEHGAA